MRLPLLLLVAVAVAVGSVGTLPPAAAAALSALSALNALNPWMSACDLSEEKEEPRRTAELDDKARALCAGKGDLEAEPLPHCRERLLFSALNASARKDALYGDATSCFYALRGLLAVDELARTATGDLHHVLARYDCGQTFSVIHSCADCQEAYRRWVCSSLLPLFSDSDKLESIVKQRRQVEGGHQQQQQRQDDKESRRRRASAAAPRHTRAPNNHPPPPGGAANSSLVDDEGYYYGEYDDGEGWPWPLYYGGGAFVAPAAPPAGSRGEGERAAAARRNATSNSSKKQQSRPEQKMVEARKGLDNRLAGNGSRSRRSGPGPPPGGAEKRYRVKPCLSVCQAVEQACPYFLPADKAPSYPTQYAGEPTFLCLDPNIEEVKVQLNKSNYGLKGCCYFYCNDSKEVCFNCTKLEKSDDQPLAQPCLTPSSSNTSESSSASIASSASVIILFVVSLPILNSAYNKIIVLHMQLNLNYLIIPVDALTFDTVYYCIKKIMKIIPCTRL